MTAEQPTPVGTPWTVHNASLPAYPPSFTPPQPLTGDMGGAQEQAQAQEGPLAQYPSFSLVDEHRKWQRIQEWALTDSAHAAADGPTPAISANKTDDAHSIGSTMLELELARASSSQHATVVSNIRAVAAAAAGGANTVSAAATDHAAAAYSQAQLRHLAEHAAAMPASAMSAWAPPARLHQPAATNSGCLPARVSSSSRPHGATSGSHPGISGPSALDQGSTAYGQAPDQASSYNRPYTSTIHAERSALEGRLIGVEDELAAAERRHAQDTDRLRSRVDLLEQALESERLLTARATQQLQAERLHARGLTEAETAARDAEASLQEKLDRTKKSLELEKRRSSEASQAARTSLKEQVDKVAELVGGKTALEEKLRASKDTTAKLTRQLDAAARQEQELRSQVAKLEVRREEQQRLLEGASSQIDGLRREVQTLNTRQAARDQKLLRHVEEVEAQELGALRDALDDSRSELQLLSEDYACLRDCVVTLHQTLSPQPMAAAFGYDEEHIRAFNTACGGDAEGHKAMASRLQTQRRVSGVDTATIVARVRALLQQAQSVFLGAERQDVACRAEMDLVTSGLRNQVRSLQTGLEMAKQEQEGKQAALSVALKHATGRVEELMLELSAAQQRAEQADDLRDKASDAEQMRHMFEQASQSCHAFELQVQRLQDQLDLQERRLKASEQARQEMEHTLRQSSDTSAAKEERIKELRGALASANEALAMEKDDLKAKYAQALEAAERAEAKARQAGLDLAEADREITSLRSAHEQVVAEREADRIGHEEDLHVARADLLQKVEELETLLEGTWARAEAAGTSLQQVSQSCSCASSDLRKLLSASPSASPPVPSHILELLTPLLLQLELSSNGNDSACISDSVLHAPYRLSACLVQLVHSCSGAEHHYNNASKALRMSLDAAAQLLQAASRDQIEMRLDAVTLGAAEAAHVSLDAVNAAAAATVAAAEATGVPQTLQAAMQACQEVLNMATSASQNAAELARQNAELNQRLKDSQKERAVMLGTVEAEWGGLRAETARALQASEKDRQRLQQEVTGLRTALVSGQEESTRIVNQLKDLQQDLVRVEQDSELLLEQRNDLATQLSQGKEAFEQQRVDATGTALKLADCRQQLGSLHAQLRTAVLQRDQIVFRYCIVRKILAHANRKCRKAAELNKGLQAKTKSQAVTLQLGELQLRKTSARLSQAQIMVAEQEARLQRADTLLPRLEERRISLESEKRALGDKLSRLTAQLSEASRAHDMAQRADTVARKEAERLACGDLQAADMRVDAAEQRANQAAQQAEACDRRAVELMEQLEGAELALRDSLSTASKLHKECEALRSAGQQLKQMPLSAAKPATPHDGGGILRLDELTGRLATPDSAAASSTTADGRAAAAGNGGEAMSGRSVHVEVDATMANALAYFEIHSRASHLISDVRSVTSSTHYSLDNAASIISIKDQRIGELRQALSTTMAERSDLKRQLEVYGSSTSAGAAASAEVLSRLQAELAGSREQLAAARQEAVQQRQQLERCKASLRATECSSDQQLDQLREELHDLHQVVAELTSQLEASSQVYDLGQAEEMERSKSELSEALAQKQGLEDRVACAEDDLAAARTRTQVLKEEVASLGMQLEEAVAGIGMRDEQLADLQEALSALNEAGGDQERDVDSHDDVETSSAASGAADQEPASELRAAVAELALELSEVHISLQQAEEAKEAAEQRFHQLSDTSEKQIRHLSEASEQQIRQLSAISERHRARADSAESRVELLAVVSESALVELAAAVGRFSPAEEELNMTTQLLMAVKASMTRPGVEDPWALIDRLRLELIQQTAQIHEERSAASSLARDQLPELQARLWQALQDLHRLEDLHGSVVHAMAMQQAAMDAKEQDHAHAVLRLHLSALEHSVPEDQRPASDLSAAHLQRLSADLAEALEERRHAVQEAQQARVQRDVLSAAAADRSSHPGAPSSADISARQAARQQGLKDAYEEVQPQLLALVEENRDLMAKLAAMHDRVKAMRSKQADAQVHPPPSLLSGGEDTCEPWQLQYLIAEREAFKNMLINVQTEAAWSAVAAASPEAFAGEHQRRLLDREQSCRVLELRLQASVHQLEQLEAAHAAAVRERQDGLQRANEAEMQLAQARSKIGQLEFLIQGLEAAVGQSRPTACRSSQQEDNAYYVHPTSGGSGASTASAPQCLLTAPALRANLFVPLLTRLDTLQSAVVGGLAFHEARQQELCRQADYCLGRASEEALVAMEADVHANRVEAELSAACRDLDVKASGLQKTVEQQQQQVSELQAQLCNGRLSEAEQVHQLQQQLLASSDQQQQLATQRRSLQQQLADALRENQELAADAQQLKSELEIALKGNLEATAGCQEMEQQLAASYTELQEMKARCETMEQHLHTSNSEKDQAAARCPSLQEQLDVAMKAHYEAVARIQALEQELAAMVASQDQAAAQGHALRSVQTEQLQDQLAICAGERERAVTDCLAMQRELAASVNEQQKAVARCQALQRNLDAWEAEGRTLRASLDEAALAIAEKELAYTAVQEHAHVLGAKYEAEAASASSRYDELRDMFMSLQDAHQELQAHVENGSRHFSKSIEAAVELEVSNSKLLKDQLDRKNGEIRELNQLLKAWEAMRLGKDAQIASLIDRSKRNEEDAAEKARTIEALRRKLMACHADISDRRHG